MEQNLDKIANRIRRDIIEMLAEAGSGHSAGPLGMADIFTALYFAVLRHDPKKPQWEERDRLILSNGHICPVRYAAMARAGYFPVAELKTLRKLGSRLQGHPERTRMPSLETTSGPLGSGLSQAAGMAYAGRMDKVSWRVYCLLSDGELQAGNTWEAAMFAGVNRLSNLTAIVDRNNIQISGDTEDIMPLEPLRGKFEAFGWRVQEIDGHNIQEVINACGQAQAVQEAPSVILANTIPGKGVSFMENRYEWHGNPPGKGPEDLVPRDRQAKEALRELVEQGKKL